MEKEPIPSFPISQLARGAQCISELAADEEDPNAKIYIVETKDTRRHCVRVVEIDPKTAGRRVIEVPETMRVCLR